MVRIKTGNLLDKLQLSSLNLADLYLNFQRTCRVPQGKRNSLPAGLGNFPIFRVSDFRNGVPKDWVEDSYFFPMYKQEAMWINFYRGYTKQPKALIIGAGNINAISGKPFDPSKNKFDSEKEKRKSGEFDIKLEKDQNYLIIPPQPWIDGWKAEDGKVYQFVAAEMGSGETVEGQITGEETIGGLQLILYNPKPGENLIPETRPHEYIIGGSFKYNGSNYNDEEFLECLSEGPILKSFSPKYNTSIAFASSVNLLSAKGLTRRRGSEISTSVQAMGLGRGGEIEQKIYPDPYGLNVWNERPEVVSRIYLVSSNDFKQVTGHDAPPTPITYETYQQCGLPWFELYDNKLGDSKGSSVFAKLKPVSEGIIIGKDEEFENKKESVNNEVLPTSKGKKINVSAHNKQNLESFFVKLK